MRPEFEAVVAVRGFVVRGESKEVPLDKQRPDDRFASLIEPSSLSHAVSASVMTVKQDLLLFFNGELHKPCR